MPVYANQPGAVQTAYISYKEYDFETYTNVLELSWPTSYQDSPDVVAAYMDFKNTGSTTGRQARLPKATEVSVGQNFIACNRDDNVIFITANSGVAIATINPGQSVYFVLTDNSTDAGIWHTVVFGAGTSSISAAELAGYGLNSLIIGASDGTKLNTQTLPKIISSTTTQYIVTPEDYTSLIVWTSGGGDLFLPKTSDPIATPGDLPKGYFIGVNNAGSGQLSVSSQEPNINIQGVPSIQLDPGQTLFLISNGSSVPVNGNLTKWFTLGFGQQSRQSTNYLIVSLTNAPQQTLTSADASSNILEFTGTLPTDVLVLFPQRIGEWYLYNNTGGVGKLSVQLSNFSGSPVGNVYTIPKNSRRIYYSNGFSLFDIPTETNEIPEGSTDLGQVLNVTQVTPQTVGWGPVCDYRKQTIGIGVKNTVVFPAGVGPDRDDFGINIFMGDEMGSSTVTTNGGGNIGIGTQILGSLTDGSKNIGIGERTLNNVTTGSNLVSIGEGNLRNIQTGTGIVCIGKASMLNQTTGSDIISLGSACKQLGTIGDNGILIGNNAGVGTLNVGTDAIFIGRGTTTLNPDLQNIIVLGKQTSVATSNSMVIGGDINVGINKSNPTYGLDLGAPGTNFTPTIRLFNVSVAPASPTITGGSGFYSRNDQPKVLSSNPSISNASVVTAKSTGPAATRGQFQLPTSASGSSFVVNTTAVTASSTILTQIYTTIAGLQVNPLKVLNIVPGVSFTVGLDQRTPDGTFVNWLIVNEF